MKFIYCARSDDGIFESSILVYIFVWMGSGKVPLRITLVGLAII